MTFTLPVAGSTGWDVTLNAALTDLDTRVTAAGGGGGAVTSVAGKAGVVTLVPGDVGLGNVPNVDATLRSNHTGTQSADTITNGTANKAYTLAEQSKLAAIAVNADVTTAGSIAAAGGVLFSSSSVASAAWVSNDTTMAGDSTTIVPTQHAVKTAIAAVSGGGGATALTGLTDVTVTSPSNGQALLYNTVTSKWTNQTLAAATAQNVLVTVTADGSTNIAPQIQSVLDALSSSTHSFDVVVEGTAKGGKAYLNSQVRISTSDTKVTFKVPVLLGTASDPDGEGCLSIRGTVGGTTTISSGAVRGSSKVVVASATGITATKLVRIYDNDATGGGSAGWKSEMAEVMDVSGTTIYLDRPLAHAYTGTINLEYINAVTNSGFDGVDATFLGQQPEGIFYPARMIYARNCFFRNMHFKGTKTNSWSRECTNTRYSYRCVSQFVTTSFSWDYNVNSTFCYGQSADGATECQWINCYTNNLRHGFTLDKGSTGCEYTSCHAGNVLNTGFDCHGNWVSDIRYMGCTSDASVTYPSDDGTRWGFLVGDTTYPNGSSNISFIGCMARNFLPYTRGGAGGSADGCGFGVVDGCSNITYRACKVYDSTSGVMVLSQGGTAPITNVTISNCEFSKISGNPIYVNAGIAPGDVNGVVISNCEFIDGNNMSSVLIAGQSGNTIGNIVVKGCTWNMSTLTSGVPAIDGRYVDDLVIDGNLFNRTNRGVAILNCAAAAITDNTFKKLGNATDAKDTLNDAGGNTSFVFAGNQIVGYFPTSWSVVPSSTGFFVEFVPAARNVTTAGRPSANVAIGQLYDITLNKPIWSVRAGVWKDATGATV